MQQAIYRRLIGIKPGSLMDGFARLAVTFGQQVFPKALHLHQQLTVASLQQLGIATKNIGMHQSDFLTLLCLGKFTATCIFQAQSRIGQQATSDDATYRQKLELGGRAE